MVMKPSSALSRTLENLKRFLGRLLGIHQKVPVKVRPPVVPQPRRRGRR